MTTRLTTLFLMGALAVPGVAAAKPGDRDFQHTFPLASRLCQRVADGNVPHRFADAADQVTAACGTLQSAYGAAVAAATPGDDAGARRETVRAYRQAIHTARQEFWSTVKGLRASRRD